MAEISFKSQFKKRLGSMSELAEGKFTKRDKKVFSDQIEAIFKEVVAALRGRFEKMAGDSNKEKEIESFKKKFHELENLFQEKQREFSELQAISGEEAKKIVELVQKSLLDRADRLRQDINRLVVSISGSKEKAKSVIEENVLASLAIAEGAESIGEVSPAISSKADNASVFDSESVDFGGLDAEDITADDEALADRMLKAVGFSDEDLARPKLPKDVAKDQFSNDSNPIIPEQQVGDSKKERTPQEIIQFKIKKLEEIDFSQLKYLRAADELLQQLDKDFREQRNKNIKFAPADIKKRILDIHEELVEKLAGEEGMSNYEKFLRSKYHNKISGYLEIRELSLRYEKLKLARIKEFFEKFKVSLSVGEVSKSSDASSPASKDKETAEPVQPVQEPSRSEILALSDDFENLIKDLGDEEKKIYRKKWNEALGVNADGSDTKSVGEKAKALKIFLTGLKDELNNKKLEISKNIGNSKVSGFKKASWKQANWKRGEGRTSKSRKVDGSNTVDSIADEESNSGAPAIEAENVLPLDELFKEVDRQKDSTEDLLDEVAQTYTDLVEKNPEAEDKQIAEQMQKLNDDFLIVSDELYAYREEAKNSSYSRDEVSTFCADKVTQFQKLSEEINKIKEGLAGSPKKSIDISTENDQADSLEGLGGMTEEKKAEFRKDIIASFSAFADKYFEKMEKACQEKFPNDALKRDEAEEYFEQIFWNEDNGIKGVIKKQLEQRPVIRLLFTDNNGEVDIEAIVKEINKSNLRNFADKL